MATKNYYFGRFAKSQETKNKQARSKTFYNNNNNNNSSSNNKNNSEGKASTKNACNCKKTENEGEKTGQITQPFKIAAQFGINLIRWAGICPIYKSFEHNASVLNIFLLQYIPSKSDSASEDKTKKTRKEAMENKKQKNQKRQNKRLKKTKKTKKPKKPNKKSFRMFQYG